MAVCQVITLQTPMRIPGCNNFSCTSLSRPMTCALLVRGCMSNFAMRDLLPGLTEQAKKHSRFHWEMWRHRERQSWNGCFLSLRLQAGEAQGYSPDTVELKGGYLLILGQRHSSAPAKCQWSLAELGPAQLQRSLVSRHISDCQFPSDSQVSEETVVIQSLVVFGKRAVASVIHI